MTDLHNPDSILDVVLDDEHISPALVIVALEGDPEQGWEPMGG